MSFTGLFNALTGLRTYEACNFYYHYNLGNSNKATIPVPFLSWENYAVLENGTKYATEELKKSNASLLAQDKNASPKDILLAKMPKRFIWLKCKVSNLIVSFARINNLATRNNPKLDKNGILYDENYGKKLALFEVFVRINKILNYYTDKLTPQTKKVIKGILYFAKSIKIHKLSFSPKLKEALTDALNGKYNKLINLSDTDINNIGIIYDNQIRKSRRYKRFDTKAGYEFFLREYTRLIKDFILNLRNVIKQTKAYEKNIIEITDNRKTNNMYNSKNPGVFYRLFSYDQIIDGVKNNQSFEDSVRTVKLLILAIPEDYASKFYRWFSDLSPRKLR